MTRHEKSVFFALRAMSGSLYADRIERIYLFGSCARGTNKYGSDVDLLVVSDSLNASEKRELRGMAMPTDLSLPEVELKFADSDMCSLGRQFKENIEHEGVLLWERR